MPKRIIASSFINSLCLLTGRYGEIKKKSVGKCMKKMDTATVVYIYGVIVAAKLLRAYRAVHLHFSYWKIRYKVRVATRTHDHDDTPHAILTLLVVPGGK